MDIFRTELEKIDHEMRELLSSITGELKQMPEGYLNCYSSEGKNYYTHILYDENGRVRKGINRNRELVSKLARKDYLLQMQSAAENNTLLLHKLLAQYQSMAPEDIRKLMNSASQKLPDSMFLADGKIRELTDPKNEKAVRMEVHRIWAQQPYNQSTYKPEEKIHLTSSGIYVRSKSEAVIEEKLFDYDLPHRYEMVIMLDGKEYAPDFTFRDADGKLFFWEHAGMMNDVHYVRRHLNKMSVYERKGIVPWNNLIVTYDTVDGAINTAEIDSIIRLRIFPRL